MYAIRSYYGCSGLQYGMKLEAEKAEDDWELEIDGVKLLVDPMTMPMIDNVTIDFVDTLTHTGFKFDNRITSYNVCYTKLLRFGFPHIDAVAYLEVDYLVTGLGKPRRNLFGNRSAQRGRLFKLIDIDQRGDDERGAGSYNFV